ncbi:MAG: hypothetical protein PVJ67_00830 [Candidatus Pacearchaeota archaeon]|jgi:hypothetical protein
MIVERFSCYRGNLFGDASDYFVDFARKKGHEVVEHLKLPEKTDSRIFILNVNPSYVRKNALEVMDLIKKYPETDFYIFNNEFLGIPEYRNLKSINLANKVSISLLEDLGETKKNLAILRGGQTQ